MKRDYKKLVDQRKDLANSLFEAMKKLQQESAPKKEHAPRPRFGAASPQRNESAKRIQVQFAPHERPAKQQQAVALWEISHRADQLDIVRQELQNIKKKACERLRIKLDVVDAGIHADAARIELWTQKGLKIPYLYAFTSEDANPAEQQALADQVRGNVVIGNSAKMIEEHIHGQYAKRLEERKNPKKRNRDEFGRSPQREAGFKRFRK